jgi:uncharacterized LabA/DUF88 family protein
MQNAGFVVKLHPMEGEKQKQTDVAIGSYTVWRAAKGDNIVLSSGDIDFLPAVELVRQETDRSVILFTYNFGVHEELIDAASVHWLFEDYPSLVKS